MELELDLEALQMLPDENAALDLESGRCLFSCLFSSTWTE